MDQLEEEFAKRGPWRTRFEIDGRSYGGNFVAKDDRRIQGFFECFPKPGRVLELGCREGGHTLLLANVASEVVAIDSRLENLERAKWASNLLNVSNVRFVKANLETFDFAGLGQFDTILNCGLLYHLPEPWDLLRRLKAVGQKMFLATHLAPTEGHPAQNKCRDGVPIFSCIEQNGYPGVLYRENLGFPQSGMSQHSFWPTRDALLRMLSDAEFESVRVISEYATGLGRYVWVECPSINSKQ